MELAKSKNPGIAAGVLIFATTIESGFLPTARDEIQNPGAVVEADLDRVQVEIFPSKYGVCRTIVRIEILKLRRPALRERVFDAGTSRPTEIVVVTRK